MLRLVNEAASQDTHTLTSGFVTSWRLSPSLSKLLDQHARQFVVMVNRLVEDVLVDPMQERSCLATAFW